MTDFSIEQAKADGRVEVLDEQGEHGEWTECAFKGVSYYHVADHPYNICGVKPGYIRNLPSRPAADEHVVAVQVQDTGSRYEDAFAVVSHEPDFPARAGFWREDKILIPRTELRFRAGKLVAVKYPGGEWVEMTESPIDFTCTDCQHTIDGAFRIETEDGPTDEWQVPVCPHCLAAARAEAERLKIRVRTADKAAEAMEGELARLKREVTNIIAEGMKPDDVRTHQADKLYRIANLCTDQPTAEGEKDSDSDAWWNTLPVYQKQYLQQYRMSKPDDAVAGEPLRVSVREAARRRTPLGGPDAQALEGALQQVERQLAELRDLWERASRAGVIITWYPHYGWVIRMKDVSTCEYWRNNMKWGRGLGPEDYYATCAIALAALPDAVAAIDKERTDG